MRSEAEITTSIEPRKLTLKTRRVREARDGLLDAIRAAIKENRIAPEIAVGQLSALVCDFWNEAEVVAAQGTLSAFSTRRAARSSSAATSPPSDFSRPASGSTATPLMEAAGRGDVDQVRVVLTQRPNLEARDENGWTALHHACLGGALPVLELLLDAGADVNAKAGKRTAIMMAADSDQVEMARLLYSRGAEV